MMNVRLTRVLTTALKMHLVRDILAPVPREKNWTLIRGPALTVKMENMEKTVPQFVLARLKTLTYVTKFQATAHAKMGGKDRPVQEISMNVKILLFVKLIQCVKTQMDPILVIVMRDIHWRQENALSVL